MTVVFINGEEFEGNIRVVGRRVGAPNGLDPRTSSREQSEAWRRALGGVHIPKGVFRFQTHEEADEWLWRMITRPGI